MLFLLRINKNNEILFYLCYPDMRHLRKYIKIFIALVLPLYLGILANSISNMHIHVLANGMVVRHAHPYNHAKGGSESHQHTSKKLSFYDGFFLDFFDNSAPPTIMKVDLPLVETIGETHTIDYSDSYFNFASLRAPPLS
ncbi:hypothetical protein ACUNWD_12255 [Sunxiuqinia sp. A32]|uniref:hypothetical protein n=1 Tax=Sunxiuqinia sp. A32 TaxID=3461496 RepID=UPI00404607D4